MANKRFLGKEQAKQIVNKIENKFINIESGLTKVNFSESGTATQIAKYVTVKESGITTEWKLGGGEGKVKDVLVNGKSILTESGYAPLELTDKNYAYHFSKRLESFMESGYEKQKVELTIYTHNFDTNTDQEFKSFVIRGGDNITLEEESGMLKINAVANGGVTRATVEEIVHNEQIRAEGVESDLHDEDVQLQNNIGNLRTYVDNELQVLESGKLDKPTGESKFVYDLEFESGTQGLDLKLYTIDLLDNIPHTITKSNAIRKADRDNDGIMSHELYNNLKYAYDGLNQEIIDRKTADSTEKNERVAADDALQLKLTLESGIRQNADITLGQRIDAEVTARQNKDTDLQSQITVEVNRAKGVESGLDTKIDLEIDRAVLAESGLKTDIIDEETRAKGEEYRIEHLHDSKFSELYAKDAELKVKIESGLLAEETERLRVDAELRAKFIDYITRIEYESGLNTKADEFTVDFKTVKWGSESGTGLRMLKATIPDVLVLKGMVTDITKLPSTGSRGDTYLVGESGTSKKDYYVNIPDEATPTIVNWQRVGDTSFDIAQYLKVSDAQAQYVTKITYNAGMSAERILRESGDNILTSKFDTLNSQLSQEIVNRTAAESGLTTRIAQEESGRVAADTQLNNKIITEEAARESGDYALEQKISVEVNRAKAEEVRINNALENEILRAITAESGLESGLARETALRESGDNILQALYDELSIKLANEVNRSSSKDTELETAISTEKTRAETKEGELALSIQGFTQSLQNEETARKNAIDDVKSSLGSEISRAKTAESGIMAEFANYYKKYDGIIDKNKSTYSAERLDELFDDKANDFDVDYKTTKWTYESGGDRILYATIPSAMKLLGHKATVADLPIIESGYWPEKSVKVGDTWIVDSEHVLYTALGHEVESGGETYLIADEWVATGTTDIDLSDYVAWKEGNNVYATKKELNKKQERLISGETIRTIGSSIAKQEDIVGSGMLIIQIDGGTIGAIYSQFAYLFTSDAHSAIKGEYSCLESGTIQKSELENDLEFSLAASEGYKLDTSNITVTSDPAVTTPSDLYEVNLSINNEGSIVFHKNVLVQDYFKDLTLDIKATEDTSLKTKGFYIEAIDNTTLSFIAFKDDITSDEISWTYCQYLKDLKESGLLDLQYSLDDGTNYQAFKIIQESGSGKEYLAIDESGTQLSLTAGQRVYIKNNKGEISKEFEVDMIGHLTIGSTGRINVGGKMNSLFGSPAADTPTYGAFMGLFASGTGHERATESKVVNANLLIVPQHLDDTNYTSNNGVLSKLFLNDTDLVKGPSLYKVLSATEYTFADMFSGCTSLKRIPEIQVEFHSAKNVVSRMFKGCGVGFYLNQTADHSVEYKTPNSDGLRDMFADNSGDGGDTPDANETYYINGTVNDWDNA